MFGNFSRSCTELYRKLIMLWVKNLDKTFEGHGYYKSCTNPQIKS